ncbi:hypothetical protein FMEAI12_4250006 [Parafrankia sp. Ea1.12]|nr:hypothetical protein FMEAI12_4250006 [Parafrankia sp. Ea1.12]
MRPAWRLLAFAGFVTLALNVAEPLIERNYSRAAFDAVGPLLLIGWAEVGPGLFQAMQAIETTTAEPTSVHGMPAVDEESQQSVGPGVTSGAERTFDPVDDVPVGRCRMRPYRKRKDDRGSSALKSRSR